MTKLDLPSTTLTYRADPDVALQADRRLMVLIPENADYPAATHRIWELARSSGGHVQLLGLCSEAAAEAGLRRGLVTLASLLQDGGICTEMSVTIGTDWLDVLKPRFQTGDVIVCFAGQQTGVLQRPLSQVLQSRLNATVYILSGLAPQKAQPGPLPELSAWLGFLALITGFGLLQARIVQLPEGWFQNLMLMLSVIPELWLISVWNGWFG